MTIFMLAMLFNAPLVGVRKRWQRVLHAVEMQGIPFDPDGTATSVCGVTGLRILAADENQIVLWPPYVEGLAPRHERCKACFDGCKKKRPRSRFAPRKVAS